MLQVTIHHQRVAVPTSVPASEVYQRVAVPISVPASEVYQRVAVPTSAPASEVSTHQPSTSTKRSHRQNPSTSTTSSSVPSTHQPSTSTKRSHKQNLSISTTSSLPPHKKLAPAQVASPRSLFSSPDRSDLKQALRSGGTASLDVAQGEFCMIYQHALLTGSFL